MLSLDGYCEAVQGRLHAGITLHCAGILQEVKQNCGVQVHLQRSQIPSETTAGISNKEP